MKQRVLVSAVLLGLATMMPAVRSHAQSTGDQSASADQSSNRPANKKAEKLKEIIVTGSLIPQAQVETASPIITITTQQLEKSGFGTVYDALRAQPIATGAVQDNQFTGGFTPGATTISLLGLDPGFTLYLINGHPMADYPLLYNGTSNFVDLTDIPTGMVDHIDILPGNQSSIYGSSAIAGVVNIILKDHIDGYELNVRGGGTTGGGGANERVEFLGGQRWGNLDINFGLQFNNQQPIFSSQRALTASRLQNPDPALRYGARTFVNIYYDSKGAHYQDPGQAACTALSFLDGGTLDYELRPNRGHYCGTKYDLGYSTIKNKDRAGTGYLNFKYKLNDSAELYGNLLYNVSGVRFTSGPYFWETNINGGGLFFNSGTGRIETFQHLYSPEEIGNYALYGTHNIQRTYNGWTGVRGTVGNSNWDYDFFFARSQQNLTQKQRWPLKAQVEQFFQNQFLGPQLGTTSGYPIYNPNVANFYKAITPAQYATFNGLINFKSETWTQNINLQVNNTDLFEMPAGSAGFAGLFQYGKQTWQNPTDPRVIAGDFYGLTGTSGGGTRNNYAWAGELRVPIFSMLTADGSLRYDNYSNQTRPGGDSKATYKLGLEFRPLDSLLFRANYATAFRAPDMAFTFGGQSGFFQGGLTDYYRCAKLFPTTPLTQCQYFGQTQVFGVHTGNPNLQSITAKSYGGGVVWSPTPDFDIKADYYNIRIKNEVQLQDIDQLLRLDSACLLGQLDITSPTCVATLAQVQRAPGGTGPGAYQITGVTVFPINIANERVSGILASIEYRHDFGRWGAIGLGAKYNVTLNHKFQQYPYDPTHDLLRNPFYSTEFKTIASANITWDIDKFSTTLYGTRYGSTGNFASQQSPLGYANPNSGTLPPWMIYNASLAYNITDDMKITGIVNNIKNSMPARDSTYTSIPYYNFTNYNPYGRSYWVEFDWRFGRGAE